MTPRIKLQSNVMPAHQQPRAKPRNTGRHGKAKQTKSGSPSRGCASAPVNVTSLIQSTPLPAGASSCTARAVPPGVWLTVRRWRSRTELQRGWRWGGVGGDDADLQAAIGRVCAGCELVWAC